MIGNSPAFQEMIRLIHKIAGCDVPVLIEGETGTGKELAARAMHYQGKRRDMPFIPVNCGAIPDSLFENELFGHERGAFTDAKHIQPGLITLASSGTLFLDEVAALSVKGQAALLRFLQDQYYRPLGGKGVLRADVRVVAASNASLAKLAEAGQLRTDLLFRLKILYLELPPLRARKGDVRLLAEHFIRVCSAKFGQPVKTFHPETLAWFENYSWPGNIRELENLVYREFLLAESTEIHIKPLTPHQTEHRDDLDFNHAKAKIIADFEKGYLSSLMAKARGNITLAAKMAHKERRALGKLLKKHGIDKSHYQ